MPSERRAKATRRAARTSQRSSAASKAAAENGSGGVVETAQGEDQTQITAPALVIVRQPGNQPGSEDLQFITMNGMDHLAIPMLLELALKISRENLGLPSERSK